MTSGVLFILAGLIALYALTGATLQAASEVDPVDTSLQRTWPIYVTDFARAISVAEGFGVQGAAPTRTNNPGDIFPDGDKSGFATIDDGWHALWNQVQKMFDNTSHIYNSSMSIREVASHYTETQQDAWAANVANEMGVTVDTTLDQIRAQYA